MAVCPHCRTAFPCCTEKADTQKVEACWCMKLPPLPPQALKPLQGCLCPACLRQALGESNGRPDAG